MALNWFPQANIEEQIYRYETAYLEETSTAGNIVKGFDNYIKASAISSASAGGIGTISGSAAGGGVNARRKVAINDMDRVFSRSSVGYTRDSDSATSAQSTPNHAATPTGSFASGNEKTGGDKKKKKGSVAAASESEADARPNKRQKITFGPHRRGHDD